MKKKIFTLLLMMGTLQLSAQTILNVSEDTYIYSGTIDDEVNDYDLVRGEEEVLISYFNESRLYRRMVFLKFDLTTLPAKSAIKSIKLKMYGIADEGGGINTSTGLETPLGHQISVYNMNGTEQAGTTLWNEATFNYTLWVQNYDHARNPNYVAGTAENVTGEGWIEWDITNELLDYVIGLDDIVTLYVCDDYIMKVPTGPDDNTNSYVTFHSKENESGNTPHLVIEAEGGTDAIATNHSDAINYEINGDQLSISEIKDSELIITDLVGRVLHRSHINDNHFYTFPHKGVYMMTLKGEQKEVSQKILIK